MWCSHGGRAFSGEDSSLNWLLLLDVQHLCVKTVSSRQVPDCQLPRSPCARPAVPTTDVAEPGIRTVALVTDFHRQVIISVALEMALSRRVGTPPTTTNLLVISHTVIPPAEEPRCSPQYNTTLTHILLKIRNSAFSLEPYCIFDHYVRATLTSSQTSHSR